MNFIRGSSFQERLETNGHCFFFKWHGLSIPFEVLENLLTRPKLMECLCFKGNAVTHATEPCDELFNIVHIRGGIFFV